MWRLFLLMLSLFLFGAVLGICNALGGTELVLGVIIFSVIGATMVSSKTKA